MLQGLSFRQASIAFPRIVHVCLTSRHPWTVVLRLETLTCCSRYRPPARIGRSLRIVGDCGVRLYSVIFTSCQATLSRGYLAIARRFDSAARTPPFAQVGAETILVRSVVTVSPMARTCPHFGSFVERVVPLIGSHLDEIGVSNGYYGIVPFGATAARGGPSVPMRIGCADETLGFDSPPTSRYHPL